MRKFNKITIYTHLLHLNAGNKDMVVLIQVIEVEHAAILHDRVVLLSDLISLRQVSVIIVLPVELDLREDSSSESKRGLDSQV